MGQRPQPSITLYVLPVVAVEGGVQAVVGDGAGVSLSFTVVCVPQAVGVDQPGFVVGQNGSSQLLPIETVVSGVGRSSDDAQETLVEGLTVRELDVLRLIDLGLSNPDIADELKIAVGTAAGYVRDIYSKFGIDGRSSGARVRLIQCARELNLL